MNNINFLIEKIKNYDDPTNYKIHQGEYYIDYLKEGILLASPGSVVLLEQNGKISRLGNRCNNNEWQMHCDLYETVSKHGIARMEIPIERKSVILDDLNLDYTLVERPNQQLGTGFFDDISSNILDDQYFLDYIDQVSIMLEYIIPLSKKHDLGLPTDLLGPYKRNKDDIGYFWIDFKRWNKSTEEFYEKKIRTLYLSLLTLGNLDYKTIMTVAEKKWGKILK